MIYLGDTIRKRQIIQSERKVDDAYLFTKIISDDSLSKIYAKHFSGAGLL
jgi:hypothetical protein